MSLRQKLRLLLASTRVANLPSVVSNVWLGVALSVYSLPSDTGRIWPPALQLSLAGILLYVSGNLFNDWHDRHWDLVHRPERALPQGAFPPLLYLGLATLCVLTGVTLAGLAGTGSGLVAVLIVTSIVIYTRWHKQSAWAVLLMGLCRALLPLLFFCQGSPAWMGAGMSGMAHIAPAMLAILFYICGLSLLARGESSGLVSNKTRLAAWSMMVLAGLLMATITMFQGPLLALLGLLPFCFWLATCSKGDCLQPARRVAALLAGIPLLDWVILLPISLGMMGHGRVDPTALTCLLLPPLACLSGRCLQRLAPAT